MADQDYPTLYADMEDSAQRTRAAAIAFEKVLGGGVDLLVPVNGYGNQPTIARRVKDRLDPLVETIEAAAQSVGRFAGARPTAPTQRLDGTPLQAGDEWLNTANSLRYSWSGSSWAVLNASVQQLTMDLSGANGDDRIGRGSGTVGSALDAVEASLSGVTGANGAAAIPYKGSNVSVALDGKADRFDLGAVVTDDPGVERSITLGDLGLHLLASTSATRFRMIPAQAAVAWPANTKVEVFNDKGFALRISPMAGVAIVTPYGKTNKVKIGGTAIVRKIRANQWSITGDLEDGPQQGASVIWGDSNTFGVGSTPPYETNGYVAILRNLLGRTIQNEAISASMIFDQIADMYRFTIGRDHTTFLNIGTNDRNVWGTAIPYRMDVFKRAHMAALVWMAVPDVDRVYADNAACTYLTPGSWSANGYGKINTKYTATVGQLVTVPFYGRCVYVHYMMVDGNVASAEAKVDNVLQGTINLSATGVPTILGATFGPGVLRISNLSEGPHTLELKLVSNSPGGFLQFLGISVPSKRGTDNQPRANAMTIINTMTPANNADIATYNAMIASNVGTLISDGLNVVLSDINSVINNSSDMYNDLHMSDQGHAKAARKIAADV